MVNSRRTGVLVGEQPRDAAVVFVAQHDRGHRLGDVERAIVEGANLAVIASGVVQAHLRPR